MVAKNYFAEGEEEAEWLQSAGLGELTEPWKAGREVQPEELGAAVRTLSKAQAEAVTRRVKSLNHTVKQRFNQRTRARKPDIRDVFKDVEVSSTGTRSRSATPDSLDSTPGETPVSASPPSPPTVSGAIDSHQKYVPNEENKHILRYSTIFLFHYLYSVNVPSFVSIFHRPPIEGKEIVRRLPSAPMTVPTPIPVETPTSQPIQEIFRRTGHWSQRGDVASDSGT